MFVIAISFASNCKWSVKGHRRKPHVEQIGFALPQIADIDCVGEDFSVGPIPDSCGAAKIGGLFDDLIGAAK